METKTNTNILRVRNLAQKLLWDEELSGQISDGMWENTRPFNHYKSWCWAEVIVDPSNVGRNFYAMKDNYNFASTFMLECIGDRMLAHVQASIPTYTLKDMKADLRDLKTIVRVSASKAAV